MVLLVTRMPGRSFAGALPPMTAAQQLLRERLEHHVTTLAGDIGERNLVRYPALTAAADYVDATFTAYGYEPARQTFAARGYPVCNIEGVKAGTDLADEIVVVGAHYDSISGSPGANDNATGVAAVLEMARGSLDTPLRRTVRFAAFVNEEPPYSYTPDMGSRVYAEALAGQGARVTAMVSLETIGYYDDARGSQHYPFPFGFFYPDRGNFIGFVGNLRSRALVRDAIASFRAHAAFPSEGTAAPGWVRGIGWSDHWSFWRAGYPAIMVTDTAPFRYHAYHTHRDLPEMVSFERLARVVDGLTHVVVDLAGGVATL